MKNISLVTLLVFLSTHLISAKPAEDSIVTRLNAIYVDEVTLFGASDPGMGATAEVAYVFDESDEVLKSFGLEVGYIGSEIDDFGGFEVEIDMIPVFLNYTVGGEIGESGLIWEAGIGLGGVLIEVDDSIDDDEDLVAGGQLFGSLGHKFTEGSGILAGIRYMTSSEADVFGDFSVPEDEILKSVAIDFSLYFTF